MKRLEDYKGAEALELWADLLDPLMEILTDDDIKKVTQSGQSSAKIASTILKNHSKAAEEILLRIDPEPIDAFNVVLRLISLLAEIGKSEEMKSFFGFAVQAKTEKESSGSPMESTGADEI